MKVQKLIEHLRVYPSDTEVTFSHEGKTTDVFAFQEIRSLEGGVLEGLLGSSYEEGSTVLGQVGREDKDLLPSNFQHRMHRWAVAQFLDTMGMVEGNDYQMFDMAVGMLESHLRRYGLLTEDAPVGKVSFQPLIVHNEVIHVREGDDRCYVTEKGDHMIDVWVQVSYFSVSTGKRVFFDIKALRHK